jgi:nucleoside-diphosphate-sugar epimerase
MNNKIRAIITGATGMVGEGVMHVCLQHPDVESVLVINRRPVGITHPKLKEIIHIDFHNLSPIEEQLEGYNACFFCLGVSSIGMKEREYYNKTYTLTMHVAETLSRHNRDMVFCYISGAGTDSTEKGRSMWARVKGKTENDLTKLPFKRAYGVRPGFIKAIEGQTRTLKAYKYVKWLFPIGRKLWPAGFCTMRELALAMINLAKKDFPKNVISGQDIIALAKD